VVQDKAGRIDLFDSEMTQCLVWKKKEEHEAEEDKVGV
jgi:hypothetical protein